MFSLSQNRLCRCWRWCCVCVCVNRWVRQNYSGCDPNNEEPCCISFSWPGVGLLFSSCPIIFLERGTWAACAACDLICHLISVTPRGSSVVLIDQRFSEIPLILHSLSQQVGSCLPFCICSREVRLGFSEFIFVFRLQVEYFKGSKRLQEYFWAYHLRANRAKGGVCLSIFWHAKAVGRQKAALLLITALPNDHWVDEEITSYEPLSLLPLCRANDYYLGAFL